MSTLSGRASRNSTAVGRVAVYTAGLGSPWSAALRAWSGSLSLWERYLHWLSRPVTGPAWRAGLAEEGGAARLVIEAEAAELGQGLEARASARTPGGATEEVALRETAPGRYEGAVTAASDGAWRVALRMRSRDGAEVRALRGFYFVASRERAAAGVNRALLARLAEATGGSLLDAGEGPVAGTRSRRSVSVRPALLAAALIVFFLEIVLGPSLADAWWRWRRRRNAARGFGTEVAA